MKTKLTLIFAVIIGIISIAIMQNQVDNLEIQTSAILSETQHTETALPTPIISTEYTATAYCGCSECCGKYARNRGKSPVVGSSGEILKEGVSIASCLPYGTIIIITGNTEANGVYVCQDRPAQWIIEKYDSKIIDIYFERHEDADKFGKQTVHVEIIGVEQ